MPEKKRRKEPVRRDQLGGSDGVENDISGSVETHFLHVEEISLNSDSPLRFCVLVLEFRTDLEIEKKFDEGFLKVKEE